MAGKRKSHSQDASITRACKLPRYSSGRPGQPALIITEEMLLRKRDRGLTRIQMAEDLGVSDSTIKRRLKDFNISLRKTDSKEGMNGSGSDTGMSLFGEVQGVLKIGKARGVQDRTPLCPFSDVATRQSEVTCANSGQSVPSEVAAVSSCSPVTTCFQGQGRKRKHHRITTADFKRITTDDIRGEDYPDVDMEQKITVAKCLIPDLSAPAQALDPTQSAGEYDYEKQSYVDGGQHAIAPGGARVKEGCVIVAEYGAEEGYDVGHAQSSHSEVDASISVPSKKSGAKVSELMDILDTSFGQIAVSFTELIPELQEEKQQMECLPSGELQALKDSLFNSLENPVSCSEKGQAMADVGLPNGDQKHSICLADLGLNLELGNVDTWVFSPKSEVSINMMALNIHPQTETPKPLTAPDSGASAMKGGGEARSGGVLDCYMFEQEAAASTVVVSATVTAELPLFPPQQPGAVKGPGIVSQGMWVSEDSRPVVQNSFPDDSDLENGGMALLANFQPQEHGQFKGKTIQVLVELGQDGAVAGPILGHSPSQTEYGTRNESEFSELIKLLEESGSQPLITDLEGQQSIEREGQVFGVAEGASQFVKMLPGQVGQQKETCQLQGFDVAGGASQVLETPSGQVDQQGQRVAGQRMRNEQLVSFSPGQLGHGLGPGSDFLMQDEYVAADQLNGSAQFQESWQGQGVLEVGGASQMIYSGQGQIDQQMPERGGVWTELYEIRGAGQIMDGVAGQKLPGQIILGPDEMGWINQSIGGGPDGKQGQGVVLPGVDKVGGAGQSIGGGPDGKQGQGVVLPGVDKVGGAGQSIGGGPDGQQGQGVVLPGVDKMGGAGQSAGGGSVGQQIPVQVILGQGGVLPGMDELVGAGQSAAGGQQIPGQMTFDEPGQMIFDEPGQMIFDEPGQEEGGNVPNFDMIVD